METHPAESRLRSTHRQGCYVVTLISVRHGDADCGIAPVVLHAECDVAQRARWFLTVAPPSVGETLERSPSMSQL
jgi:hypothetical protein